MGAAASRTTNPLLLALIVAVVAFVVSRRRSDAPWATGFRAYLVMGLVIVGLRVLFRALLEGQHGTHVLITLPELPLPDGAEGIRIGGPVSLEGLLAALYDGMRLATLIICIGGANTLANPKRLLKSLPAALHEVGVSVTVALSVAPQLVESARRIARARRLRGDTAGGLRGLARRVGVPVLTDALDRSLLLAAAMDARGYGRRRAIATGSTRAAGALVLTGLAGVCIGTYGLLDATTPPLLGMPLLATGLALAGAGFAMGGRRVRRSVYRPDPWAGPEWGVTAAGLLAAGVLVAIGAIDPTLLNPPIQPLTWPTLPPLAVGAILVGALPAWIAPPVPATTAGASSVPARTAVAA